MALPLLQEEPSYDSWKNNVGNALENTQEDAVRAAQEQGAETGLTQSASSWFARKEAENAGGKILTPQELNKKYGPEGIFFKEATNEKVADQIATRRRQEAEWSERIGTGPSGFIPGAERFVKGGWETLKNDPAGVAVGALAGLAATALLPAAVVGAGPAVAFGELATHAAVTGAIASVPFTAVQEYDKHVNQYDLTAGGIIKDYATNFALGLALDVGIQGLTRGVKFAAKKGWDWQFNSNSKTREWSFEVAMEQAYSDKRPNLSIVNDLIERERTVEVINPDGSSVTVDHSGRIVRRSSVDENGKTNGRFFYGTDVPHEDFNVVDPTNIKPFEKNFGTGYYITDDAIRANRFSASKFGNPGIIHELDLRGANILNSKERFPQAIENDVRDLLIGSVRDKGLKAQISEAFDSGASIEEIFDKIHEFAGDKDAQQVIGAINDSIVKKAGYDGYSVGDQARKDIMLFPEARNKLEAKGAFEPNHKIIPDNNGIDPTLQEQYNASMNAPEAQFFHNPVLNETIAEMQKAADIAPEEYLSAPALKDRLDAVTEQIKTLMDEGLLSPADRSLIEEVMSTSLEASVAEKIPVSTDLPPPISETIRKATIAEKIKAAETAIKSAIFCVGK